MRKILALSALLLPLTCAAFSVNGDKVGFVVRGSGTTSCGKFVEIFQRGDHLQDSSWLNGYLTAINRYIDTGVRDIAGDADRAALMLWIYNYCNNNPLDAVSDAAHQLFRHLMGQ